MRILPWQHCCPASQLACRRCPGRYWRHRSAAPRCAIGSRDDQSRYGSGARPAAGLPRGERSPGTEEPMNERDEFLRDRLQPERPSTPAARPPGPLPRDPSARQRPPSARPAPPRSPALPPALAAAARGATACAAPAAASAPAATHPVRSAAARPPRPPGRLQPPRFFAGPPTATSRLPGRPTPASHGCRPPAARGLRPRVATHPAAAHLWAGQAGSVARPTPRGPIRSGHPDPSPWQPQGRRAGQGRCGKDVGRRQCRIAVRRTPPARPRRGDRRRYRVRPIEQPNRSADRQARSGN